MQAAEYQLRFTAFSTICLQNFCLNHLLTPKGREVGLKLTGSRFNNYCDTEIGGLVKL